MILESPNTLIFSIFKSMVFLRPCTSASYSVILLVQSNSNLQERKLCLPLGSINKSLSYPFVYDVKVFLFVNFFTPMYKKLILCLIMHPYLLYSSHFGHILSNMILKMIPRFHISQGTLTVLKEVHISKGTCHILQEKIGIFMHAWTSSTHAPLNILECPPFSSFLELFLACLRVDPHAWAL
jgi:hypothetical protein